jgi:hypothetical protein
VLAGSGYFPVQLCAFLLKLFVSVNVLPVLKLAKLQTPL